VAAVEGPIEFTAELPKAKPVTWRDFRGAVHSDLDYDDPAAGGIRGLVEDTCAKWRSAEGGLFEREMREEWTQRHAEGRP
jgi:hypothetical protein